MQKQNEFPVYVYQGQEVGLVSVDLVQHSQFSAIAVFSYTAIVLAEHLMANNIPVSEWKLSYDDSYTGGYCSPSKISFVAVTNFENKQKLVPAIVTREYYEQDMAERELVVDTDSHYDWRSERHDMILAVIRAHRNADGKAAFNAAIDTLRKEWAQICEKYNTTNLDSDDYSFDSILSEVDNMLL